MGLRPHLWAAVVPVTCPVYATCIHETDLQSVWPGVLSLDMCLMCVALGFNVILAVVRKSELGCF